ncbi:CHAT domain-containing protein [Streptomyces sp. NBC_00207]|uniref:CHAT domain-containing protein n=1 Tax=Streptomyces sp. NBC_00207 TaxID=2903635 RepID=UPI003249F10A
MPSLRALAQARETAPAPPGNLLIIAVPKAPDAAPLPNVDAERAFLTREFPRHTLLHDARRESARDALSRHTRVHFACHATQNLVAPSEAGFVLQDGLLSLTDLLAQPPSQGELAVLSACQTATGGITHLDEVMTLANALHHTGWRHVIATQFSVWDDAAARFTELLYPLLSEQADPAEAVHAAVRILRDAYPNSPSRWAPYLHTGP